MGSKNDLENSCSVITFLVSVKGSFREAVWSHCDQGLPCVKARSMKENTVHERAITNEQSGRCPWSRMGRLRRWKGTELWMASRPMTRNLDLILRVTESTEGFQFIFFSIWIWWCQISIFKKMALIAYREIELDEGRGWEPENQLGNCCKILENGTWIVATMEIWRRGMGVRRVSM